MKWEKMKLELGIAILLLFAPLMLVGCAGITTTTSVNEQLNKDGQQIEILQRFIIGMDIDPAVVEKLSAEQLTAIYTAMASAKLAPGGSMTFEPHLEFHQTQGTDAESQAEQSAKFNAELTATIRDIINRSPSVPAP